MERDQNHREGTVGRWLRIGILTVATLGPIVNTIIERMRERSLALRQLKETPYAQELLKRGSDLTGTLTEQGSKIGQVLAERGSGLSEQGSKTAQAVLERGSVLAEQGSKTAQAVLERGSVLAEQSSKTAQAVLERGSVLAEQGSKTAQAVLERSNEVSRDLAKRGSQVSRDLVKRSGRVTKEVTQRGQKATQELAERGSKVTHELKENRFVFWATFGVGLLAAAAATYLFMQKRLQRQSDEEQLIPLEPSGTQNGFIKMQTSSEKPKTNSKTGTEAQAAQPAVAVAEQPVAQEYPAGTRFLGVVSSKRYYSAETPQTQLPHTEDGKLDVVYFSSEEEAKTQGFSAA